MPEIQKKIVISGQDAGVGRVLEGMTERAKTLSETLKDTAKSFTGLNVPAGSRQGLDELAGEAKKREQERERRQEKREESEKKHYETLRNARQSVYESVKAGAAELGITPDLFSLQGLVAKIFKASVAFDNASSSLDGFVSSAKGLSSRTGGASMMGITNTQLLQFSRAVALATGSSANLNQRTLNQLGVERAFSLGEGTLNMFGGATRRGAGEGSQIAMGLVDLFRRKNLFGFGKGDFTQLSEKLDQTNQILQQQAQTQESLKGGAGRAAGLMSVFSGLGGAWGGSDTVNRMMAIHQGMVSPGNDFKQALIFRAIQKTAPGADLFEVEKLQEQGLFGPQGGKILREILQGGYLGERGSVTERLNLKRLFGGLSHEAIEKLQEGLVSGEFDPSRLPDFASEKDLNKAILRSRGRAEGMTGVASQNLALIEDKAAEFGNRYVREVGKILQKVILGDFSGAFGDLSKMVSGGLEKAWEGLKDLSSSVWDTLKEWTAFLVEKLEKWIDSVFDRLSAWAGSVADRIFWWRGASDDRSGETKKKASDRLGETETDGRLGYGGGVDGSEAVMKAIAGGPEGLFMAERAGEGSPPRGREEQAIIENTKQMKELTRRMSDYVAMAGSEGIGAKPAASAPVRLAPVNALYSSDFTNDEGVHLIPSGRI